MTLFKLFLQESGNPTALWTRSGDFGNSWYTGQFHTNRPGSFTVTFEVITKGGEYGDVAIDDVSFVNGVCSDVEGRTHDIVN